MTRTTKTVLGGWLMCASALAACVDNDTPGVESDTDATAGAVTATPPPTGVADTEAPSDSSSVPPDDSSGGGSGAESAGSSDTSTPGTTGVDDPTGSAATGCQKVDLLFVIDNDLTMKSEQEGLIGAFPAFYDGIKSTLGMQDTHVMAIGADDGKGVSNTSQCLGPGKCFCGPAPLCCAMTCEGGNAETCNGIPCAGLAISECASQYGAGRDYSNSGKFCEIADGRRYMLDSQPDLPAAFDCAASVGQYEAQNDKRPMFAATEAVSAAMNGAGGCDEGFLRSDALLVVVFVSDKDDTNENGGTGSPGGPQEWYDALVAAKGGNAGSVVVLGLVGDGNMTGGGCAPNMAPDMEALAGGPAPRLQEFVSKFSHSAIGSICAADYGPFFTNGITVVDQACDAFTPG
ncbi:hypothetical protein [Nannocystis punicea]|uniref:Uncharacterized protein n=1 Tax=Nannocystis punicea TaxID=2995304 RepID=A0ABY7H1B2_9BACT|nr:hypothetical protein [Nannocystis poenicansa]WAS92814.1 hypothetical protein O0S08_42120 [Nannocystis poenicansa]